MMKNKLAIKLINIGFVLLVLILLILIVSKDIAWNGKLTVETNFLKFTPYFSILKPQPRIDMKADYNHVREGPIYFDLYLPRDFDRAKLDLEYKNEYGYNITVGPNIKDGWDLKPLGDLADVSSDYQIKSVEYKLADKNINNGKLRFMVDIPDLKDPGKGVFIRNLKITLLREPIYQGNLWQNLSNYIKYVKNQF
jgi:hypothetical protein